MLCDKGEAGDNECGYSGTSLFTHEAEIPEALETRPFCVIYWVHQLLTSLQRQNVSIEEVWTEEHCISHIPESSLQNRPSLESFAEWLS